MQLLYFGGKKARDSLCNAAAQRRSSENIALRSCCDAPQCTIHVLKNRRIVPREPRHLLENAVHACLGQEQLKHDPELFVLASFSACRVESHKDAENGADEIESAVAEENRNADLTCNETGKLDAMHCVCNHDKKCSPEISLEFSKSRN